MRRFFVLFGVVALAAKVAAQTSTPVKLAVFSASDVARMPADALTAVFSGNDKVQLLERNEIEKVYREQGLSAANTDSLKLGRILGAEGLLVLDLVRSGQGTNLTARLIAVKPGVVLTDMRFTWPPSDVVQWSQSTVGRLDPLLPKLALLSKEAIPVSLVNLRSAVQSAAAPEMERQLRWLTVQRLSREPRLFVLERQQMQSLTEEKNLSADDSAFWSGSYLLEGVVDPGGYSPTTLTISGRLTPPEGAAPLHFEVSGSRTNYAEIVDRLGQKVVGLLNVAPTAKEWNAADESERYYEEAKWALKWGVYAHAQAAADAAWALGKRDLACAMARVRAYADEATRGAGLVRTGSSQYLRQMSEQARLRFQQLELANLRARYKAFVYQDTEDWLNYAGLMVSPEPWSVDRAQRALEL